MSFLPPPPPLLPVKCFGKIFDTSIASHHHDPQLHTTVSGKTHRTHGYMLRVPELCPEHRFLLTPAFTQQPFCRCEKDLTMGFSQPDEFKIRTKLQDILTDPWILIWEEACCYCWVPQKELRKKGTTHCHLGLALSANPPEKSSPFCPTVASTRTWPLSVAEELAFPPLTSCFVKAEVHRWRSSHPNPTEAFPSPSSLLTTLIPFSSSVLFSTNTSNTCITTVPDRPNCLFQHISTTCCFSLWPKLTVPWRHKGVHGLWERTAIGKGTFWNTNEGEGITNPWQDSFTVCQQSLIQKLHSLSCWTCHLTAQFQPSRRYSHKSPFSSVYIPPHDFTLCLNISSLWPHTHTFQATVDC